MLLTRKYPKNIINSAIEKATKVRSFEKSHQNWRFGYVLTDRTPPSFIFNGTIAYIQITVKSAHASNYVN